jgi:eukaryotic-like serine/threonine-protein kinase
VTIGHDVWSRARELFERALEEAPGDPLAWLESRRDADPAVRAEVASLLQHHSRAGDFLSEPVLDRAPALFDGPTLEPGTVLGPYTIEREIGAGGMGRVVLARDSRLGRAVALKAVSPALARDTVERERLRREAQAAAALTHPGICTIYALEELDGELYIAAEYIDGRTLREELAAGRRPTPAELLDDARTIAAALASAHGKGLAHRDIKPENVMRRVDGQLKILDFGLARLHAEAEAAPRITQPGALVGTPAYMAPEQLNGGAVDARADVFALGVLLYELATGRHPFEAPTPLGTIARVLESEPRPVAAVRSDVPDALARAIGRALRKEPSERFSSAGEMLEALSDAQPHASGVSAWWRTHQTTVLGLYFVAAAVAWQVKEWQPGLATQLFTLVGVTATVGGVFRGHLLFTERMTRRSFAAERRRANPVTLVVDLVIALALAVDGLILQARPLATVLTIALGVGLALARLLLERSTAAAAFGD